jgi:hypothetical protein
MVMVVVVVVVVVVVGGGSGGGSGSGGDGDGGGGGGGGGGGSFNTALRVTKHTLSLSLYNERTLIVSLCTRARARSLSTPLGTTSARLLVACAAHLTSCGQTRTLRVSWPRDSAG